MQWWQGGEGRQHFRKSRKTCDKALSQEKCSSVQRNQTMASAMRHCLVSLLRMKVQSGPLASTWDNSERSFKLQSSRWSQLRLWLALSMLPHLSSLFLSVQGSCLQLVLSLTLSLFNFFYLNYFFLHFISVPVELHNKLPEHISLFQSPFPRKLSQNEKNIIVPEGRLESGRAV